MDSSSPDDKPAPGYRAFISYSQHDSAWAGRLHRWLESFRLPRGVKARACPDRRLGRFFRDSDEMAAASDLASELRRALEDSESLIVLCSPHSARSKWVEAEIQHFRHSGRGGQVFAFIIEGDPKSDRPDEACYPPSFRDGGESGGMTVEPFGVDVRVEGRERACTRLIAGMLGLPFDTLWQRQRRRKRQATALVFSAGLLAMSLYALSLAMGTRNLNSQKSLFLAQMAQLQTDAVASDMDEDQGQYDRAIRYAMLATQPGILHPDVPEAQQELVRALLAAPSQLQLNPADKPVIRTAISPGKSRLVMVYADGQLELIDLEKKRLTARIDTGLPDISNANFHPLRNWILLDSDDGQLHLWDLDSGRRLMSTARWPLRTMTMSFSDDGRYLLQVATDRYRVWDLEDGELIDEYSAAPESLNSARWVPGTSQVAARDAGYFLDIRDPVMGESVYRFGDDTTGIRNFDFNAIGSRLYLHERSRASSDKDSRLAIHNLNDFSRLGSIPLPDENMTTFLVSQDERYLITTREASLNSGSSVLEFLNLRNPSLNYTAPGISRYSIGSVTRGPGDDLAIVNHRNGVVRIWGLARDISAGPRIKVQGHNGYPVIVSYFRPLANQLITHGGDGTVTLWELDSYTGIRGAAPFDGIAAQLTFSDDGQWLLASSPEQVSLIQLQKQEGASWSGLEYPVAQTTPQSGTDIVSSMFVPGEENIFFYLTSGEIGHASREENWTASLHARIAPIAAIATRPGQELVGIASEDGIYVQHTSTLGLPTKLADLTGEVTVMDASPDGKYLAAGTREGKVEVWLVESGERIYSTENTDTRGITNLIFSPDSSRLMFTYRLGDMHMIDTKDWVELNMDAVNEAYLEVSSLTFPPDGKGVLLEAISYQDRLNSHFGYLDFDATVFEEFLWSSPGLSSLEFVTENRLLAQYSLPRSVYEVYTFNSPKSLGRLVLTDYAGPVAYDPHDRKAVVASRNRILVWPLELALEEDVGRIRQHVCSGAYSREALVVTERDTRFAPAVAPYVGDSVCELGPDTTNEGFSITRLSETPADLLAALPEPGSPAYSSAEALREYLAYFPFDSLLDVSGTMAGKALQMAAAGYASGLGTAQDTAEAERLNRLLAEQGNPVAMHNLSALLETREGENTEEAGRLLEQAAGLGFWYSNRLLGVRAAGEERMEEARQYLERAVEAGDGESAWLLALIAASDSATGELEGESCQWLEQAFRLSAYKATFSLVGCLETQGLTGRARTERESQLLLEAANQDSEPEVRIEALRRLDIQAAP